MRLIKALLITLIFGVVLYLGWSYYSQNNDTQKTPERYLIVDHLEKDGYLPFELNDINGKKFSSDLLKDKVVILSFWASWCAPCVAEFPAMIKLVNLMKGQVLLIAVSQDRSLSDITTFFKSIEDRSDFMHVLWDEDKSLGQKYGVERLPESFVIGKNGKLVKKIIGLQEWGGEDAHQFFKSLTDSN